MASAGCVDNHEVYIELVELEAESTFAFQGSRWLADVAPHLLPPELRLAVVEAKETALLRQRAEARIPKHLLYSNGWPTGPVTSEEADLIADVRREVASLLNLKVGCLTRDEVVQRYDELLLTKAKKDAAKAKRGSQQQQIAERSADDGEGDPILNPNRMPIIHALAVARDGSPIASMQPIMPHVGAHNRQL